MEKKYVVPDGMLEAVERAVDIGPFSVRPVVEAALKYQAEHPPVPSEEQAQKLAAWWQGYPDPMHVSEMTVQWMRIAYLAPEPEIPEAVEKLMWDSKPSSYNAMPDATHNRQIIEAYELGLRDGRQG